MKRLLVNLLLATILNSQVVLADSICDFNADGLSEFIVVNPGANGNYDWQTFNPRNGSSATLINGFGNSSSKFIPGNWIDSSQAIAAIVDPVAPGPNGRATWTVKVDDKYSGSSFSYTRLLGRPGDIIILGGDYDANGVSDSLILKRTTGKLGLRVNFFLSSYNGNNLGKERLYRALGSPFKDKNFYFSPDGITDYLAVIKKSTSGESKILMLKPFSDRPLSLSMGILPSAAIGPIALKQGAGKPDLLVFYQQKKTNTLIFVKDQSGNTVDSKRFEGNGTVLVGDYLADRGNEIAVQNNNSIELYNPITKGTLNAVPPQGQLISCVGNLIIQ